MSFQTLEKYLYRAGRPASGSAEPKATTGYFHLTHAILSALSRSVLAGEAFVDLNRELEAVRDGLSPNSQEEILNEAADRSCFLLEQFKHGLDKANEERDEDFRKVLAILNEAFTHLGSRTERSEARLKKIEVTLQHAAKLEDVRAIKTHLTEVLRYVRQESAHDQSTGKAEVEALNTQICQVNKAALRLKSSLAGKKEALQELKSLIGAQEDTHRYAALFVADSLSAMRTRHGDEIAENLLEQLGKKEMKGLVPEGKVFCWSPSSVLMLWSSAAERENVRDLGKRLKSPFEYKAVGGSRMATFAVGLRSAVMRLDGSLQDITWELDHFERGDVRC